LRNELKNPQGLLIEGSFEETMKKLRVIIEKENPTLVISVGDIVSQQILKYNLGLNILIVDNKTMRKPIPPIKVNVDKILYAKNPPGTITNEAWTTIQRALENEEPTKVIIDGEEDLLTIVSVISAPEKALVIYGQPKKGIVVVKVTEKTKKKMQNIIDAMNKSSKS
jgi:uncharacterized protein (UPF0218 family)